MATTTPTNIFPSGVKPFSERPLPKTICMFDVDGTLTLPLQDATPSMLETMQKLRKVCATAIVGGSDHAKIHKHLNPFGDKNFLHHYDYIFSENGLTAYKLGNKLDSASFIGFVGEEEYKKLVNFILRYLSELDIPIKRGTFIEFRTGMINVSPIGRNASTQERNEFQKYDAIYNIRPKMVEALKEKFGHLGLTFSIGGQISFDVFPTGWDKTYSLKHIEDEGFTDIHFFGDKTFKGGNDYEIFSHPSTIGHSVTCPDDTQKILEEEFIAKHLK